MRSGFNLALQVLICTSLLPVEQRQEIPWILKDESISVVVHLHLRASRSERKKMGRHQVKERLWLLEATLNLYAKDDTTCPRVASLYAYHAAAPGYGHRFGPILDIELH